MLASKTSHRPLRMSKRSAVTIPRDACGRSRTSASIAVLGERGRSLQEMSIWRSFPGGCDSEGYVPSREGQVRPDLSQVPACYGFTIIANVKPGTAETIRGYGLKLAKALRAILICSRR